MNSKAPPQDLKVPDNKLEPPPSYDQIYPAPDAGAMPPAGASGPPPPPYGPMNRGQPQYRYAADTPDFGPHPLWTVCPYCQHQVMTKTRSEPSPLAWLLGVLLCAVGCFCLSCVPCCVDSLQTVTHHCPNCGNFLGRYKGSL